MTALRKNKQTTHEIELQGQLALLDLTGAMYLPDRDTLLVADLHFEKGSSFARRGMMLPPYDTRETLLALADAVFRFDPLPRHRRARAARRRGAHDARRRPEGARLDLGHREPRPHPARQHRRAGGRGDGAWIPHPAP